MKKKWVAAELITTDICETAATDYCVRPDFTETSGQNTKDCTKCPSWWHGDEWFGIHFH